jgi:hypothetical protein
MMHALAFAQGAESQHVMHALAAAQGAAPAPVRPALVVRYPHLDHVGLEVDAGGGRVKAARAGADDAGVVVDADRLHRQPPRQHTRARTACLQTGMHACSGRKTPRSSNMQGLRAAYDRQAECTARRAGSKGRRIHTAAVVLCAQHRTQ